ncbi:protein-L-isoaspartate O-methyltransferase [archaeon]|nr:protein-L-isoaspartate O-methyltransferase [archaeon]
MNKQELIESWNQEGLKINPRVLDAFRKIKREDFVPQEVKNFTYVDTALKIGYEQTISQPKTVVLMLGWLELQQGNKVLEIGTGSGYNTALISELIKSNGMLYTTEIIPHLYEQAKERLRNYPNIEVLNIDGTKFSKGKLDRIVFTAGLNQMPSAEYLNNNLNNGGIFLAPIGPEETKNMIKIVKRKDRLEPTKLGIFNFVPVTH